MNKLIATLLLSILPLANAAEDLVFEYTPEVKKEKKAEKKKKVKKKKKEKKVTDTDTLLFIADNPQYKGEETKVYKLIEKYKGDNPLKKNIKWLDKVASERFEQRKTSGKITYFRTDRAKDHVKGLKKEYYLGEGLGGAAIVSYDNGIQPCWRENAQYTDENVNVYIYNYDCEREREWFEERVLDKCPESREQFKTYNGEWVEIELNNEYEIVALVIPVSEVLYDGKYRTHPHYRATSKNDGECWSEIDDWYRIKDIDEANKKFDKILDSAWAYIWVPGKGMGFVKLNEIVD
jgi:hypothetical protein